MNTFSTGEAIRFGWRTFKSRPWLYIGASIVVALASWLGGLIAGMFVAEGVGALLAFAINITVGMLIGMGEAAFFLKAHAEPAGVQIADLWHPRPFWKYVGVSVLTTLAIGLGLILLVVPGIIVALMVMFSCYLVIDRQLGPIEAMKESRRITKGHLMELFLLALALIGINILGFIALFVGLLVSIPVSMLAFVYAYRSLSRMTPAAAM